MQDHSEPKPVTRSPSNCPIIDCPTVLSEAALLDHLLNEHKNIDLKRVDAGEKAILTFQESIFPYGQPVCMGIVLYGGKDERSRPVQMGISQKNSILTSNNLVYENHYPVLVMGCKTHMNDMLGDDALVAKNFSDICQRRDPRNDIFVLWLVGPSATRPVHGDLTITDSERINMRGCRMQVRDFKSFLQPGTFLSKGLDYLMVNRGAMNLLTGDGEQPLEMELFIQED